VRARWRWLLAVALLLTACGPAGEAAVPSCVHLGVPAYVGPADLARLGGEPAVRYVVLNPANGPDVERDEALAEAVAGVQAEGPRVLGYVHTSYGARPLAEVEADIDRYRLWYGVDGIFVDEVADTTGDLPYYRRLTAAIRARSGDVVALNPGVYPARAYYRLADVVVTFEDTWARYRRPQRRVDTSPAEQWHLVLGADEAQMRRAVRLAHDRGATVVDVTDRGEEESWNRLPAYLDAEAAVLNRLPRCGR
jgi:hypothetical protein